MKHLWEIGHPYYCSESNYYAPGNEQPHVHYKSWQEFLNEWGDADFDYNLLFRWDWHEGEDYDLPPFNGDVYYRNGVFYLFWMGQRKGLYQWTTVEVCRADEEEIIKFLKPRLEYLKKLWEPLEFN
jgi:hypothetical protein